MVAALLHAKSSPWPPKKVTVVFPAKGGQKKPAEG